MTKDALSICQASIDAVNPSNAIQAHLSYNDEAKLLRLVDRSTGETLAYDVSKYHDVYIAAFGKAASSMGLATSQIVSQTKLPIRGMVITKDDHATKEQIDSLSSHNIDLHYAGHPIPDRRSIRHSHELLSQLKSLNSNTLVINCISGGGSSLFCTPKETLNLSQMSQFNQQLLACGMPITEMNVLRKKVEIGKGGGLVRAASPSTCITMVLSDVIGDPLDLIASGPSVKDESTWSDAWNLVQRYGLGKGGKYELSDEILGLLQFGKDEEEDENLEKNGDHGRSSDEQIFVSSETVLVGNNALAVSAAAEQAKKLGYNPVILGTTIEGEAVDIANMYVNMAEQVQYQRTNPSLSTFPIANLPLSLIAGGETTVTLTENSGKGGRNQEIGLAAALKMRSCNLRDIVLASVGTDGTDGPTDAAGAVVDGGTIDRVEIDNGHLYDGEEALRNHDAYTFFDGSKQDNPLVKIGATGTNVADVCVTLVK
jgi:glycerate 2-kinase